jgi:hypothetical protein
MMVPGEGVPKEGRQREPKLLIASSDPIVGLIPAKTSSKFGRESYGAGISGILKAAKEKKERQKAKNSLLHKKIEEIFAPGSRFASGKIQAAHEAKIRQAGISQIDQSDQNIQDDQSRQISQTTLSSHSDATQPRPPGLSAAKQETGSGADPSPTLLRLRRNGVDFGKFVDDFFITAFKDIDDRKPEAILRFILALKQLQSKEHQEEKGRLGLRERAFKKLIIFYTLSTLGKSEPSSLLDQLGKQFSESIVQFLESTKNFVFQEKRLKENVQHFWAHYLARAKPRISSDAQRNIVRNYDQGAILDRSIYGADGSFFIEGKTSPFRAFDFLFYLLRAMVFDEDNPDGVFEDGKTHNLLPRKPDRQYWVVVNNALTGQAAKIAVPINRLGMEGNPLECEQFNRFFQEQLATATFQDYGAMCTDRRGEKRKNDAKKGFSRKHCEEMIKKPDNFDVADIRINFEPRVQSDDPSANLEHIQNHPFYQNLGTPFCLQLSMDSSPSSAVDQVTGEVATLLFHSETDAQSALNKLAFAVSKAHETTKKRTQIRKTNVGDSFLPVVTDEQQAKNKKIRDFLQSPDPSFFASETYADQQNKLTTQFMDAEIQQSQLNWEKVTENNRLKKLYDSWAQKFSLYLSPAILETYTIMIAEHIEHAHFLTLNKHEKGIVPILTLLSPDIRAAIFNGGQPGLPKLSTAQEYRLLMEIMLWQIDKIDGESELADACIPVISVIAQGVTGLTKFMGNTLNKKVTEFLTSSTLISPLSNKGVFLSPYQKAHLPIMSANQGELTNQQRSADEFFVEAFGTAMSDVHSQAYGTIKHTPSETIITRRFKKGKKLEKDPELQKNIQVCLENLIGVLEKVAEDLPALPK